LLQNPQDPDRLRSLKDLARSARTEELPAVSLNLLGATLLDTGDPAGAEGVLREAQRLHPGDVWLNYDLARCLGRLGRREEAIRYYVAARSLRPETAHDLAHALAEKGETYKSIYILQDLTRLRSKEGRHLGCFGQLLQARGRTREADVVLDAAVAASRVAIGRKTDNPIAHFHLGFALYYQGKREMAIAEYREALRLKPDLSKAHTNLGAALHDEGEMEEAIAELRTATRLKPDDPLAHAHLGWALQDQGKLEEAIAEFRQALHLKPGHPEVHNGLGSALADQGKLEEAIAEFREALRLKPDYLKAHNSLGVILRRQGKLEGAIAEFREVLRFAPGDAVAHHGLGAALYDKGAKEEAIAEFRAAIHLKRDDPRSHHDLGYALHFQGKLEEGISEYREALRLRPNYLETHNDLGLALSSRGEWDEAIAELRKALDLAKVYNPRFVPKAELNLTQTERQASLAARLPAILRGTLKPSDAAEMVGFAELCYERKHHGASAGLWAEAFQAQPKLAEDMQTQHRYNAACAAALAGCGKGKDDPPLDEVAKSRWRKQAIDWLKGDLAAWSKILESGPPQARKAISQTLQHWKVDPDLAGLREPAAVAKLADDERKACRSLWAEVDDLLKRARDTKP
jgi:Flp pilus assembly protein TadD